MPEIVGDGARGVIRIGGREVGGFVDDGARCPACDYCQDRPARPLAGE